MRLQVVTIGKPRDKNFAAAVEHYKKRASHYGRVELTTLRAPKGKRDPEDVKAAESRLLLDAGAKASVRIALHERGEALTSVALAKRIEQDQLRGKSHWALLIGGAHGHDQALLDECDWQWSLSPLTMPHELALVVLMEQLYRAFTILRGEPYHK